MENDMTGIVEVWGKPMADILASGEQNMLEIAEAEICEVVGK